MHQLFGREVDFERGLPEKNEKNTRNTEPFVIIKKLLISGTKLN